MSNKLQIIIILIIPIIAFMFYLDRENISLRDFFVTKTPIVHFGDLPIRVEIADSASELTKGLSGRSDMGDKDGLFFIFPDTDYHGIWMKDMRFPIDIIWISEELEVIGITKNVSPESYPKVFRPEKPVRYVLETEVGHADLVGIHVGNKVRIPLDEL